MPVAYTSFDFKIREPVSMLQKYFSRRMPWSALSDEQIVVHDAISPNAPRMITMEPWPQLVYLAASGEHIIAELVKKLGAMYDGEAPEGLSDQVIGLIQELEAEMIVEIHDSPKPLAIELRGDCNAKHQSEADDNEEKPD